MKVKIYIEGGGESPDQNDLFREAWSSFFSKAGLSGKMVRPIRGKGRARTYDLFCQALATRQRDELILLLVDSEDIPSPGHTPWQHLKARKADAWKMPKGATDSDAFLMIASMETWLVADHAGLKRFFPELIDKHLPKWPALEKVTKKAIFDALDKATARCGKPYAKGKVSFELLKAVDTKAVEEACPAAKRFLDRLRKL